MLHLWDARYKLQRGPKVLESGLMKKTKSNLKLLKNKIIEVCKFINSC